MIPDDTPLTRGDLASFVEHVRIGLATPAAGDAALPHEVIALHSDDRAECDGKRVRLWDLMGGRTGCQVDDGPIFYCD
ncbi:hypothetical protein [Rhodoferax ferrireducens]|uniref:hypothetical protein n=1 Tax=Rhodoferax ferrireducens TaxID=192843 RepID=UPI003BB73937